MKVSSHQVNGVTIVDLKGPISLDEGSTVLREKIQELVTQGHRNVVLNLANVSDLDSSGIGELVCAFTSLRDHGGELKLLNLTGKVLDLLQITKLDTVFDVKDDEASAVAAFRDKTVM